MSGTYFNDCDLDCYTWLKNLFPTHEVDHRDVAIVKPKHISHFNRVHLFAGIGGWELALQLSQWPADRPVWTGSCPCQPFSVAGKKRGGKDARDTWSEMYRLISECCPATVFGEQVSGRLGRGWLSRVRADLERIGYAVGAADLCAASVGLPHIRQRLYWVATLPGQSLSVSRVGNANGHECQSTQRGTHPTSSSGRDDTEGNDGRGTRKPERAGISTNTPTSEERGFREAQCWGRKGRRLRRRVSVEPWAFPLVAVVPHDLGPLLSGLRGMGVGAAGAVQSIASARKYYAASLRGYGNAIVPKLAAQFVNAFLAAEKCP